MTGSLLIKILIGLAIFLLIGIWQLKQIRDFSPSLLDFSKTTDISGSSSYIRTGRVGISLIDEKSFFCGADFTGGVTPCVALAKIPDGSRITVAAATLKSASGAILFAMDVKLNSHEIYTISPEMALKKWWTGIYFRVASTCVMSIAAYILILIIASMILR